MKGMAFLVLLLVVMITLLCSAPSVNQKVESDHPVQFTAYGTIRAIAPISHFNFSGSQRHTLVTIEGDNKIIFNVLFDGIPGKLWTGFHGRITYKEIPGEGEEQRCSLSRAMLYLLTSVEKIG